MFAKRPGASVLAVVALGLGIGLTTTMFSIVQGAILRGLPFEESDRILAVSIYNPRNPQRGDRVRLHDYVDLRDRQQSFESLEALTNTSMTAVNAGAYPEQLRGARITPGVFNMLRVTPVLGRDFTAADALPGADPVVIIGHQVWHTRFGGRADAIGGVINLDGTPTTVIGVMPEKFRFPETQDVWTPYTISLPSSRDAGSSVLVVGRLKNDVTVMQADTEAAGISASLASQFPENKDIRAQVTPYVEQFLGNEVTSTLFAMLGAVLGVMIIACVNVTNLQLARAADRMKEMSVRTALGSGRWRIIRQLLTEGLLLSASGALLGLAIAQVGVTTFSSAIVDTRPPFWIDVRIDPTVLLFVTFITVLAALVASLLPGWRVARADVNTGLKDDGRGTTSLKMGRFSRALIIVEVMVSCLLLVVSGLMIRSIVAASQLEYPFPTTNVFFGQMMVGRVAVPEGQTAMQVMTRVQDSVAGIPGIDTVTFTLGLPQPSGGSYFAIEGETYESPAANPRAVVVTATETIFDLLQVRPSTGRLFNASDTDGRHRVAVVDQAFAQMHFAGASPIGKRVRLGNQPDGPNVQPWVEIVGVVPNLAESSRNDQVDEVLYLPLAQRSLGSAMLLAKLSSTTVDPVTMAPEVRKAVASVHESIPLTGINSLHGELWRRGWAVRLFGGLFLMFGFAALVLAAAGLYGVMAFNVHQRTPEIGIRMAIGADRVMVIRMILKQGIWRVGLGIALGLWPGYLAAGAMGQLLEGVSPTDPIVYTLTIGTLLLAGTLACLVPALRAASISPVSALRGE
jgi:predicted permease